MNKDLEARCKKAVLDIAKDVRDINQKMSYFLESYRDDYFTLLKNYKQDSV